MNSRGLFNVTLGSVTAIPDTVFNQNDRWLALSIGGSELSPRTRIAASAYSMRVNTVDGASGGVVAGDLSAGKGNFGLNNSNAGKYTFVAGRSNAASGDSSTVSGGADNTSSGRGSVVSGGFKNQASGNFSTLGGGVDNRATGAYSVVGGGGGLDASRNVASADWATVCGGVANLADHEYATVAGGRGNSAVHSYASVGGGDWNVASGPFSVVAGGQQDTASAYYAAIVGGYQCVASGVHSATLGGDRNRASGNRSVALGNRAKAIHGGAFVWADSTDSDFTSSSGNQFNVRSTGGVRIYTNSGLTAGVTLAAGGSAWQSVSDSTLKRNIRVVDGTSILGKLMQLPIKQWSYKAQNPDIEHIGPMAQDFYSIFKLGDDEKTICTIDPSGIALAAIQELYRTQQKLEMKTAEIDNLKAELAQLKSAVNQILAKSEGKGGNGDLASLQPASIQTNSNSR